MKRVDGAAERSGEEAVASRPAIGTGAQALVVLSPSRTGGSVRGPRGESPAAAGFLAQLLATALGVPQTRARRRAEPERAIDAYAARMRTPPTLGRALCASR
jgi:hypothetical protein